MKLKYHIVKLSKRVPLRISRGVSGDTENVWLSVESDGIEGWGSACPFSVGHYGETTQDITSWLDTVSRLCADYVPFERQRLYGAIAAKFPVIPSAAMAALDTALHDWLGKRAGLPLWKLWGLDINSIPATSVTIGIEPPERAAELTESWLCGARLELDHEQVQGGNAFSILKVKLGDKKGIEADKERVEAVREAARGADIIVDANAGWDLQGAIEMCSWLSDRGVKLVEQPLGVGEHDQWRVLQEKTNIDLFADESCFKANDVLQLSEYVDGVVIKMMKCGGLSEAIKIIHAARLCGLSVMLGCYGDCAVANTAMAHISPLVDFVDLDSHLNLKNDPFIGADIKGGALIPNNKAGIGVFSSRNKEIPGE